MHRVRVCLSKICFYSVGGWYRRYDGMWSRREDGKKERNKNTENHLLFVIFISVVTKRKEKKTYLIQK